MRSSLDFQGHCDLPTRGEVHRVEPFGLCLVIQRVIDAGQGYASFTVAVFSQR